MKTEKAPSQIFADNRNKFSALFSHVKKIHAEIAESGHSTHGHGFDHDLMVAQYGAIISPEDRCGEMAWIAGLLHSLDRHFVDKEVHRLVEIGLNLIPAEAGFELEDKVRITIALADHSKKNDQTDDLVTVILKDADRLANLGAINIIRGGQHRPNIPACIPETLGRLHPESTFKKPMSCYDATFYNTEWREMIRLPKAKQLGERYFLFLEEWRALAVSQAEEAGLYPWPG